MTICYKPYVVKQKQCSKTIIIEKVTCPFCMNKLLKEGKAEIKTVKEKE